MSKRSKRLLSWLLLAAMLCTLLPTAVFADDAAEELVLEPTEDAVVLDELEPQTEDVESEEPDAVSLEGEMEADYVEASKPSGGTTNGQPFSSGTGGSTNFRIPALVTLGNGTLVAAADARWDHTQDAADIDTIVAVSKNEGSTWTYKFVNYIPNTSDGYGKTDYQAATFIDPALATDGTNVYMLVDLYPGQPSDGSNCILTSEAGTGLDKNGNLLLRKGASATTYGYYLKDGKIYSSSGEGRGYDVDAYFNVTKDGTSCGNLFNYGNSAGFYPLFTSYLCLIKSTDGGQTWSNPVLINHQVKEDSEKFYGVGPGAGLVTSGGRIIFPCYIWAGNDAQRASLIYSDDGGETWKRTTNATSIWSSEAQMVELNDGTIRTFFRNGQAQVCYADATWNETSSSYSWGTYVKTGLYSCSNTQMSAIKYSKKINGKEAIIISYPASKSATGNTAYERVNGRIAVGLLNDKNEVDWAYTYKVNDNGATYQYSCLTELSDGSIGLLYENGEASIQYASYDIATLASGATIGDGSNSDGANGDGSNDAGDDDSTDNMTTKPVEVQVGASKSVTDESGNYAENWSKDGLDENIATVKVEGESTGGETIVTNASDLSGSYIKNNGKYLACSNNGSLTWESNISAATTWSVLVSGYQYRIFCEVGSKTYYIKHGSNWGTKTQRSDGTNFIYTSSNGGLTYTQGQTSTLLGTAVKVSEEINSTDITITGKNVGETQVTVGSTLYKIKVTPLSATINVKPDGTTTVAQTGTVTDEQIAAFNEKNGTYVTVAKDGDKLVFTGVAEGKTEACLLGNTEYTVSVTEAITATIDNSPFIGGTGDASNGGNRKTITKLTISEYGNTSQITYTVAIGNGVASRGTWASADESIAMVDQNGKITGLKAGNTSVTYTVNGVTYVLPVQVVKLTDPGGMTCDLYVENIVKTTVVYSIDGTSDFSTTQEGEVIYLGFASNLSVNFFGKEDEGYALTYMASEGSKNQYYPIKNVTELKDLNVSDEATFYPTIWNEVGKYYTPSDEQNPKIGFTGSIAGSMNALYNKGKTKDEAKEIIDAMLWKAINNGYHGQMGWSRAASANSFSSRLTFASDKLATVDKKITSITRKGETIPYTKGMMVQLDDTINYTITVTKYGHVQYGSDETKGGIVYTEDTLKDELTSSIFVPTYTELGSTEKGNDVVYTYKTSLTLTQENFGDVVTNGVITNEVTLSYNYKAQYCEGVFVSDAKAEAKITVQVKGYVVDFGLPVSLTLPTLAQSNMQNYQIRKFDAIEGDGYTAEYVEPKELDSGYSDGGSVLVTFSKVITEPIFIPLTVEKKDGTHSYEYGFRVYPANNVLYEESFADQTGWEIVGTAEKKMQSPPDKETDVYGYDTAYTNTNNTNSNGSALKATVTATGTVPEAKFSFKGTGVEIMGECGTNTGVLLVKVTNATETKAEDGTVKYRNKIYIVDTYFNGSLTNNDSIKNCYPQMTYQIPVVQNLNLAYTDHDVTVYGYYLANSGATMNASTLSVATVASELAMGAENNSELEAILEEIGAGDADVEYISMNQVLGGSDDGTAVYASQVYSTDTTETGLDVYFDGFRVYNTLETEPEAYAEQKATFVSLYDAVDQSSWNDNESSGKGIVWVENVDGASTKYSEYKTSGPENEIYLGKGKGIAFKVEAEGTYTVQVSAKNLGSTARLDTATSKTGPLISTQTELYYKIENVTNNVFVITNTDDTGILSLIDLKIIGGTLSTETITAQELDDAIYLMQNPVEPEEPKEPETPEEPEEPSKPTEPENPEEPSKPTEPENPEEPSKPTEPTEPEEPSKPTEPENPEEPSKPTEPEEPEEPSKPTEPEEPENPSEPTEPENPEEPSKPAGPEEPEDPTENWENPFKDVIFGKFYYNAVRWFHAHGIINGMPNGEFGLNISTDRAMVITMLYRMEGEPEVTVTDQFSDVKKGSYYEKAVSWAVENYLVGGYPDGTFRPKQAITREELITILYRYNEFKGKDPAGSADLSGYYDGDQIHKYAKNAMRWAIDNGIVNGYNEYGKNLVKPRSETRRSEMVTLLYRVWEHVYGN